MGATVSDYATLGGDSGLRGHVGAFIDRVFGDPIIGFLFVGRDRGRVVRHEVELAARHLGGPTAYTGRPLGATHRPLRINRGHFRRRLALLRTVLRERSVPEAVIERWLEHDRQLELVVTNGDDCLEPAERPTAWPVVRREGDDS